MDSFSERPWGLGAGKYRYDEDGDWHGLYAMAFLDSHSDVAPIFGYCFQKYGAQVTIFSLVLVILLVLLYGQILTIFRKLCWRHYFQLTISKLRFNHPIYLVEMAMEISCFLGCAGN